MSGWKSITCGADKGGLIGVLACLLACLALHGEVRNKLAKRAGQGLETGHIHRSGLAWPVAVAIAGCTHVRARILPTDQHS